VVSVIPGPSSSDQVRTNLKWIAHHIPPEFWEDLKSGGLLRAEAPVPANAAT
jgi:D-threo-aldose 1-dehydrogenase